MEQSLSALPRGVIEELHAAPGRAVVAVSGAGSSALAWLMEVPGASRTLLEGIIPYSQSSLGEFLGYEPEQYVSPETSQAMARAAYARALELREGEEPVIGLACTATIATDRPKRGDHRACVSLRDDAGTVTYSLKLAKGSRDRKGEEELVSLLVLKTLGEAWNIATEIPLALLPDDELQERAWCAGDAIDLLLAEGPRRKGLWVMARQDGDVRVGSRAPEAVLPGSFNPFHQGHEGLAKAASRMLDAPVVMEMSVTNVDKPPLDEYEVRKRVSQLHGSWDLALTCATTFREKASLFPGCTFVVGWDTAVRLVDLAYYGGSERAMQEALGEIRAMGCSFLVAGRVENGNYRTLSDVAVPAGLADLFREIPESAFRLDVSSTELRAQAEGRSDA